MILRIGIMVLASVVNSSSLDIHYDPKTTSPEMLSLLQNSVKFDTAWNLYVQSLWGCEKTKIDCNASAGHFDYSAFTRARHLASTFFNLTEK